jgi:hypothetical protein
MVECFSKKIIKLIHGFIFYINHKTKMARAWSCLEEEYPPKINIMLYFILTIGVTGIAYGAGTLINSIIS